MVNGRYNYINLVNDLNLVLTGHFSMIHKSLFNQINFRSNMNKKTIIAISLLSSLVLSGCASNDEIIAQQKQQAEQINTLGVTVSTLDSTVNTLESELEVQTDRNNLMAKTVRQVYAEQSQLKTQAAKYYSIKENDTLSRIAVEQGISLATLLKLNPQIDNANILFVGHIISIK